MATQLFTRSLMSKHQQALVSLLSRSFSSLPHLTVSSRSRSSLSHLLFHRLRPLCAASAELRLHLTASPMACNFSTRATSSSLNDPNPNWSNRPPKETILLDGCDFEHWLVVMEKPEGDPTRDEIIDKYIKTLAKVVGSEEEARMKIYSVSTRCYYAFGALVSEEDSYKLKELEGVRWVLPDSYLDVKNKDYGGEPFINGQAVPYDPKYHEEWIRNNARANERNRRNDRPRNFDRSRNFERRRENMQNSNNFQTAAPPNQGGIPSPPNNMGGGLPQNNMGNGVPPNANFQGVPPNANFQGGPPNPNYQSGSANPNYQSGSANPNYQSGSANPNYQGAPLNQAYQGGSPNQGYQGGPLNQGYHGRPLNQGYQGGVPNQRYKGGSSDQGGPPNLNYQSANMAPNMGGMPPSRNMGGMPPQHNMGGMPPQHDMEGPPPPVNQGWNSSPQPNLQDQGFIPTRDPGTVPAPNSHKGAF